MIILIATFGIVMVYSASHYHATVTFDNPFHFALRQAIFACAGIGIMLFIGHKFDYRIFSNMKIAGIIYGTSLLLVLSLPILGHESKGATRWIMLPGGITIQPSEFAKIGVILMLSAYIVKYRRKLNEWLYLGIGGLIIALPAAAVLVENLSSAIVIGAVGFIILFISTPKVWYYVVVLIIAFSSVFYALHLAETSDSNGPEFAGIKGVIFQQYRLDRFRVWQDPWLDPKDKGYQAIQSLYAIGSGGLFGQGLGRGIQKQGFLPEPHNDIIFSVICEELGLFGAACVILAYSVLIIRGLAVAVRADELFGSLVATGIVGMIAVQVLINIAVNTNTFPTTGMQLPLISYGGTALIILLSSLGLLVNISRTSHIQKPPR
ncbi:hypothetical protein AN639_06500 [Candidatus Epulonipiscium fishelsonii]|uniref:Uncharacterized protein n=1 Tax=Candidatus Epulonipiscium fishelsonii TaxID=77094 RepID=A0ACC8XG14_9FIRM|nr:hypothetical protein AN639_06500 [Epulopiscium sp. SCG-B05WGA-EpuloA1]ONI42280.1 hypothetical protein AN396_01980 [Epulopiscium sp. SCG-B11WGA-EpuloA1]